MRHTWAKPGSTRAHGPSPPANPTSVPCCSILHIHGLCLNTPNPNPQLLPLRQASGARGKGERPAWLIDNSCRAHCSTGPCACSNSKQDRPKPTRTNMADQWDHNQFFFIKWHRLSLTYRISCSHHASEDRPI